MSEPKPEWKVIVGLLRDTNPDLLDRIARKMMNYLFKRNIASAQDLMKRLDSYSQERDQDRPTGENEPIQRMDPGVLYRFIDEVFMIAAENLDSEIITTMVGIWLKNEQARFLTMSTEKRDVSLAEISNAIRRFAQMPDAQKNLAPEEAIGAKVALIRRFFSDDLDYINVTKKYTSVMDFAEVLTHTTGPGSGNGKLGGKAAGLFRAAKILQAAKKDTISLRNLAVPRTWYLTSDCIMDFLHFNALEELPIIKYRDPAEIRQEYPYLEQIFKNSRLSAGIVAGLNLALDDFGDRPLIVRSSSLLEDTMGAAFAGKYKSLFLANQGPKKERLEALIDAILEVYASVFSPDPIEYRRERGLLDFNEEMALLIQEAVGRRVGKYFFPAYAGVAFSYNEFRWSPRIRKTDGIVRMVTGLGTRAVDRVGDDYPVLVSPGQPGLRVNVEPEETLWYSQKNMDVINLETRRLETVPVAKMIQMVGEEFPALSQVVSIYNDGQLFQPFGTFINLADGQPVVTFARLLSGGPFIPMIRDILRILHDAIGFPVDIEFACDGDIHKLYLLQCRPQSHTGGILSVSIPDNIPPQDILFTAQRYVTTAQVENIEYLVYVDPEGYDQLSTLEALVQVGRVIGELNSRLPRRKFILMGPGRWGSRDIKLGVRVGYSDINNTAMLVEIAQRKKDYVPELSFGTHFFQDLVEARICYLPLYPDEPDTKFNLAFFSHSPNILRKLIPAAKGLEQVVRVIQVPKSTEGATVSILMDGETERAMAFLAHA